MSARKTRVGTASRFVALLRAINVGGRTVRMEVLRELFGKMRFTDVETFIASGNVIFTSTSPDSCKAEALIEGALGKALGFEVATFIRTPEELVAIVAYEPFPRSEIDLPGAALYVGFLKESPAEDARAKVLTLRTPDDDFHLHGRELYWLARRRMSESKMSNAVLERALRAGMTMRNITTVRKLATKYAG